jgi:ABC-type transporter Mla maintaining outer membrane lipid asymmetry ATPase subunit MlaF/ABC-type transporter Mla maintaining outer membrane lipid asymmetry permease subunit MlaE/ABC-type transporter Mla MlaB component
MSASSDTLRARASANVEGDGMTVALAGIWQITEPRPAWAEVRGGRNPSRVTFDAAAIEKWDSALLLFLFEVQQWCKGTGAYCNVEALPERIRRLLAQLAASHETSVPFDRSVSFLTIVGLATQNAIGQAKEISHFVGECTLGARRLAKNPAKFRWRDCLGEMQQCGAMALPIVSLISFLVGVTLAYTGAIVLRLYGGDIYIADLIGLSMVREMGAVMTAVVLAGRTGAAFAATLGNMRANEEIDALEVVGIPVVQFLVLPRIFALAVMMPLLAIYANALGMVGGMSVALDPAGGLLGRDADDCRSVGHRDGRDQGGGVWADHRAGGLPARIAGRAERGRRGPGGDLGGGDGAAAAGGGRRAVCGHLQHSRLVIPMSSLPPPTDPRSPAIEIEHLQCGYGDEVVLNDISLTIARGEVFFIIGGSGCGKSTLLRHIVGLNWPTRGTVKFFGQPFSAADPASRRAQLRTFGMLFQGGALWTSLTLRQNVSLPLEEYTTLSKREIQELATLKLAQVGLGGFEDYFPAEISGGMKKRAGLARALALDPAIVFFDEPSAGLDPVTSRKLDELILEVRANFGTTIVVVSHELASIFGIADRVVMLDRTARGIIAEGRPAELAAASRDPRVTEFLRRTDRREETK